MSKKAEIAMWMMITGIVIVLITIALVVFSFFGKPEQISTGVGQAAGGDETTCKEADYKFPVYDGKGMYIFCRSCEGNCLDYKDKQDCEAPKNNKCDSDQICKWLGAWYKGECAKQ